MRSHACECGVLLTGPARRCNDCRERDTWRYVPAEGAPLAVSIAPPSVEAPPETRAGPSGITVAAIKESPRPAGPMPPIIIDSREQTPLSFPAGVATVRLGIPTGDYSLEGFSDRVACERKSLSDMYACVGRERKRFERELARLAVMDYAAVVIEATYAQVSAGCPRSEVPGAAAVGSLAAWSVRYRLPVFYAGGPAGAAEIVLSCLSKWFKYNVAEPQKLKGRSYL